MNRTNFAACLLVAFVAGVGLGGGCVGQVVGPGEEPGTPGTAGTEGAAGVSGAAGVTGTAGTSASGAAGMTGVGGTGEAGRGGTTGAAGTGAAGTGAAGTGAAGRGGTTGAAGTGAGGRGGTTGAAGTGAAGRGGTTGAAGTGAAGTGAAGRGGTTGAAGTGAAGTGAAGRGGTTGAAGTGGAGRGGTTGQAGTGNVSEPPRISSGQSGVSNAWASRYWDCCKPACGWTANVSGGSPMRSCNAQNQTIGDFTSRNACESGGTAHMCWSGVPWSVSNTLSYGFAAASGDKYRCGRCYQVQFTGGASHGNPASAAPLNNKTMILQVINNGGVQNDQLDILIPGGGVGALNACDTQWGTTDLGATYGGFLTTCNRDHNCVRQRCQTVFANKPDLMAGCDWFLNWFVGADNPDALVKQIACPSGITQRSGLSDPG